MIELQRVVNVLEVLADTTRLRLLHLLWRGQGRTWMVGELVDTLQRPQPTVSRHLAILRREGFVRSTTVGQQRRYTLADASPRDHQLLLAALQELVSDTPEALRDLERVGSLTSSKKHETNRFRMSVDDHEGDAAMSDVLGALSHPTRRRMLDLVGATPGATVADVADQFDTSRAAVSKHVGVLERAGLLLSQRVGRTKCLYQNAVPVQLIYDRWTTRFTAPLARHVASVKYAVEKGTSDG